MTAQEIISKINEFGVYDFANGYCKTNEMGKFTLLARRGGTDQGSEWWRVFYFEDHDIYIKAEGCYTSYEGVYDLEVFEVEPEEVMITVYKKK